MQCWNNKATIHFWIIMLDLGHMHLNGSSAIYHVISLICVFVLNGLLLTVAMVIGYLLTTMVYLPTTTESNKGRVVQIMCVCVCVCVCLHL